MKPSFWQPQNNKFLTFKTAAFVETEENRAELLRNSLNISINGTTLHDLLLYHGGVDTLTMTEKEIHAYLNSISFHTLVAIFQGFLFYNAPKNLSAAYAETISKVLYQEGLMFAASQTLPLLNPALKKEHYQIKPGFIRSHVYLVTTPDGEVYIDERCELMCLEGKSGYPSLAHQDKSPLITIENQFHLKPVLDNQPHLEWQHDDCTVQFHDHDLEQIFNHQSMLDKVLNFINSGLERLSSDTITPSVSIAKP